MKMSGPSAHRLGSDIRGGHVTDVAIPYTVVVWLVGKGDCGPITDRRTGNVACRMSKSFSMFLTQEPSFACVLDKGERAIPLFRCRQSNPLVLQRSPVDGR